MSDRQRPFLLRIPAGYFTMTEDERQAATRAMWADAMVQIGEDADRLISERTAQGENSDDGHEL